MFKLKELDNNLNMYSAGAAFDWVGGKTKRAPQIYKKFGMEWFYRLITEPKRLWKRYIIDNSLFILLFIKQVFTKESFKKPLI
jgi:N-acetylglucosaminyldiphosphoundecaprenol N-acetyl-beta-D-mannosaminyltransferase